jgi:virulence-associated protein VapD
MAVSVTSLRPASYGHNSGKKTMYAITFDLDTKILEETYHNDSWKNAYADIRNFLAKRGFGWQQGSVYFGDDSVNAVKCVMAAAAMSREFPWFASSVRDIRMLRIEEENDLLPAVQQGMF